MVFSLEVLQAKYGDCLLVHSGQKNNPRFFLIDGGPPGVYLEYLKPRLKKIKGKLFPNNPLPFDMVMVSHLDDDHINGIIQLLTAVSAERENHLEPSIAIKNIWINTFDDIIGNVEIPTISAFLASASAVGSTSLPAQFMNADQDVKAVISSIGQGKQIRNSIKSLKIPINSGFAPIEEGKGTLVYTDKKKSIIKWDEQLKITVLHPNKERLLKLQTEWDKDLKKAKAKGDKASIISAVAALLQKDTSVFNLSSIVLLVESGDKSILLTGDARADDIYEGLKLQKLLNNGRIHVDILKMPHHGSNRNMNIEFLQNVTASHYVISANGKYGNPDEETLKMISDATKGRNDFTLHFTNHDGEPGLKKRLDDFFQRESDAGRSYNFRYREDNKLSFLIDLDEKVDF